MRSRTLGPAFWGRGLVARMSAAWRRSSGLGLERVSGGLCLSWLSCVCGLYVVFEVLMLPVCPVGVGAVVS